MGDGGFVVVSKLKLFSDAMGHDGLVSSWGEWVRSLRSSRFACAPQQAANVCVMRDPFLIVKPEESALRFGECTEICVIVE